MMGSLVAACTALDGFVHVAMRVVANVAFALGAAGVDLIRVADVALLWGGGFGTFR